jgi:Mn2+/Fe2+ NRAMP family transporter
MRLQGVFQRDDYAARLRWRDTFIVLLLAIPVCLYLIFGEVPVQLVTWGAIGQAAMLPIISFATIFLIHRRLPRELEAPRWMTALLWIAAIVITGFVLPSLAAEFARLL